MLHNKRPWAKSEAAAAASHEKGCVEERAKLWGNFCISASIHSVIGWSFSNTIQMDVEGKDAFH